MRDALVPIAREHGTTVSAVAIAWTLAWPGVTGAIVLVLNEVMDAWVAALASIVKDGKTGWLVDPGDGAGLAAAMVEAVCDEDERARRLEPPDQLDDEVHAPAAALA